MDFISVSDVTSQRTTTESVECIGVLILGPGEEQQGDNHTRFIASFPGPCRFSCTKKGGGPGTFYHVCDIKDRQMVDITCVCTTQIAPTYM